MTEEMKHIPAVALRGMTILPAMIVHFDISREMSIKAVEQAMLSDQKLFVVTQKDPEVSEPVLDDLYRIGTIVEIKQVIKMPKNILRVLAEGIQRAELVDISDNPEYLDADILTFVEEDTMDQNTKEALLRSMKETFERYCSVNGKVSKELISQIMELNDLEKATAQIAMNIPLYYEQKQKVLEAVELKERCELLCSIMENEIQILQIKIEIQEKVKERIDKNQREYIMREQMKLIREELKEDNVNEADQFEEELKKLKASKEVKEKIQKEIQRYRNIGMNSGESSVIRGYIETLLEMPWDKASKDSKDIERAREILEADHYGLEKVKERILEFLSVRILTKKGDSPILCLVGPPGTGKTSIARSIAKALDKKYVRISLGGVRDEAEIRGHRRTYIGAMPGRIANGIRTAGVKNPLMLLDEIDKLSSDYKGDTASAMLEVLDGEQNVKFRDHYIEIPLDLSEVLFIATANDVQSIPRPLLDRMELIEVTSYTENEKFHIAKEHLWIKQVEKNGLNPEKISITDDALRKVISGYTREAGVRGLERKLGEICRKAARETLEKKKKSVKITEENLEKYLGKVRFTIQTLNDQDEIGIVRGLAWTSVGGDTLQIEVNTMPGRGEFKLTGQLGDVMKESAQAGISYIRSVSSQYHISDEYFRKHDIHIHIPEGAVPKDGPSAGVTMVTAMISAITKIPVRADVAMTGEITLRGRVLPIGGLKEKLLAARNAGMKIVFVPSKNKLDVEEISTEITKGLDIRYAETMEDILQVALTGKIPEKKSGKKKKKVEDE
ncbi:Lon protease 1 [uncultured Clostridium sp.]|uniref:Lon protease n=1 Tax=Muricoprocola aceti TaxID=2981772 RepID=A0ABT2SJX3_9FIRM|nr:endopeptidase La [Muricoprocola aceti]MCU6724813.1 endopeptidase La [Muricoprocola aceti]SCH27882.1 Lon protease 1 [uncultured Clostridium sp.]